MVPIRSHVSCHRHRSWKTGWGRAIPGRFSRSEHVSPARNADRPCARSPYSLGSGSGPLLAEPSSWPHSPLQPPPRAYNHRPFSERPGMGPTAPLPRRPPTHSPPCWINSARRARRSPHPCKPMHLHPPNLHRPHPPSRRFRHPFLFRRGPSPRRWRRLGPLLSKAAAWRPILPLQRTSCPKTRMPASRQTPRPYRPWR